MHIQAYKYTQYNIRIKIHVSQHIEVSSLNPHPRDSLTSYHKGLTPKPERGGLQWTDRAVTTCRLPLANPWGKGILNGILNPSPMLALENKALFILVINRVARYLINRHIEPMLRHISIRLRYKAYDLYTKEIW